MSDEIKLILFTCIALDIVVLAYIYAYKRKKRIERSRVEHFGDNAELMVSEYIKNAFVGGVLLDNIYLKTEHGLTQLDHILLCRWGIYIIETKSHNGKIEIHDKTWIQRYKDKTVKFHSPILQNEIHKKALKNVLMTDKVLSKLPIHDVTVFTSRNVTFTKKVKGVIKLDELNRYIKTSIKHRKLRSTAPSKNKKYLTAAEISKLKTLIIKNSEKSKIKQERHKDKIHNYRRI